jgi:uncharacterized SAM-binding protein YcdF (DUF218 family)
VSALTSSSTEPIHQSNAGDATSAFRTWPTATTESPAEISTTEKPRGKRRWLRWSIGVVAIGLFLIPFLVFAAVFRQARVNEARPAGAIVVLGAAQFNGIPSQVFRARLDTAFDLYQQGLAPTIVVTGGRILGDQYTEAETGKIYLVDRGVPADAILMENVSHNTAASFEGVRRLLQPRGVESLLLVSDGFHLYRSKMLAQDAGFEALGYAAEDSPIRHGSGTELRYMVRETLAVLAWKLHITR